MKILEATHHYMDVYDSSDFIGSYRYKTYSRGSGFVFQISRTFQVYPRKKKKR
ncbi:hypothetical protein OAV92_00710 [Crocinitomicaceae bacterium]|nr:hypothetical protein [Crocinitomicaceae bacterium]